MALRSLKGIQCLFFNEECAGASAAAAAAAAAALLPARREAWMTELPPERVAPNKMEQVKVFVVDRT